MGKIFFKILKMGDSYQRQWQTLLPGGQTATKCEIIYFILIIFKDFFILHVSIIVVNRDKLERLFFTFWNPQDKTIPQSIEPLPWVVCELSNSRSKSTEFIAIYNNNGNMQNKKIFQNYLNKINDFTLGGSLPTWKQGLSQFFPVVTLFSPYTKIKVNGDLSMT